MMRLAATVSALLIGMGTATAAATPPGPVCRLPAVVDVMARELRGRAAYAWLDSKVIDEAPTQNMRVVRCGVCLMVLLYDTIQYGEQPVARCEAHAFSVAVLRNGFVVRYLQ
jgi:hypothetical protein